MRAESGPIRFEDDWAGMFIRGDHALATAEILESVAKRMESLENQTSEDHLYRGYLAGFAHLLRECKEPCDDALKIKVTP